MRILVNDIAASQGGALSVLQDFYSYIANNDKDNEWIFLLSDNYIKETDNIKVVVKNRNKKWINRLIYDLIGWKRTIEKYNPDVIFSLQNTIYAFCKYPQVLYVHQPLPFQKEKRYSILKKDERVFAIYQFLIGAIIKWSVKRADRVIVQTQWMKNALKKIAKKKAIYKINPNIPEVCITNEKRWKNNRFIYPTSDVIYKNNECIYKACEKLHDEGYLCKVEMTLEQNNEDKKNIEFIGKIQRKSIWEKYNEGTLIFPSYIETFGLPLAEARSCGTIILAADTEFAREILQNYRNAYFFNPFDSGQLTVLMKKVISGEITKKEVKEEKSKQNTWEIVVDLIEECVKY